MDAEAAPQRISRQTAVALGAMALAVVVIANDFTAFSVALPAMEKEFHADVSDVQWVINAYALVFGVCIVTGGRLADMFGRRRLFFIGTAIFTVFSLAAGLAPNLGFLVVARGLMGIGGAVMWPAILGMTYEQLPASRAGLAGGLIIAAAGLGNAIGPLIGGIFTDALSWRWIFFLNLPIAAAGALATWRFIPPDQAVAERQRLDYPGIVTVTFGLVALLLAFDLSSDWGWSSLPVIVLSASAAGLLLGFAAIEFHAGTRALLPRDIMGQRDFIVPCLTVLGISGVFFTILLYLPQFMIVSLGFSPIQAGLGLLPLMVTYAVVSFIVGPLYGRLGPRVIVTAGTAAITGGMLWLSFLTSSSTYSSLLGGMFLLGVGIGFFYSAVTTAGVTALDPSQSSLAGGIVYMCQVAGGAIGLGVSTAIVSAAPTDVHAFVGGIADAFLYCTAMAFAATLIGFLFIGRRPAPVTVVATS
jgi:EmrB/QacA subfamily drug resistance transporter